MLQAFHWFITPSTVHHLPHTHAQSINHLCLYKFKLWQLWRHQFCPTMYLWTHLFQVILLCSSSWASWTSQNTEQIQYRNTVCIGSPKAAQKVISSPKEAASGAPKPPVLSIKELWGSQKSAFPKDSLTWKRTLRQLVSRWSQICWPLGHSSHFQYWSTQKCRCPKLYCDLSSQLLWLLYLFFLLNHSSMSPAVFPISLTVFTDEFFIAGNLA